jgi:hypothetical protein
MNRAVLWSKIYWDVEFPEDSICFRIDVLAEQKTHHVVCVMDGEDAKRGPTKEMVASMLHQLADGIANA